MGDRISSGRRGVYMLGMLLMGGGVLLFLSSFYEVFTSFGGSGPQVTVTFDGDDYEPGWSRSAGGGAFGRAFGGILAIGAGRLLMKLGARGVAGSGLILDPDRARKDLSPYSRMVGGMAKDALKEAGVKLGRSDGGDAR